MLGFRKSVCVQEEKIAEHVLARLQRAGIEGQRLESLVLGMKKQLAQGIYPCISIPVNPITGTPAWKGDHDARHVLTITPEDLSIPVDYKKLQNVATGYPGSFEPLALS